MVEFGKFGKDRGKNTGSFGNDTGHRGSGNPAARAIDSGEDGSGVSGKKGSRPVDGRAVTGGSPADDEARRLRAQHGYAHGREIEETRRLGAFTLQQILKEFGQDSSKGTPPAEGAERTTRTSPSNTAETQRTQEDPYINVLPSQIVITGQEGQASLHEGAPRERTSPPRLQTAYREPSAPDASLTDALRRGNQTFDRIVDGNSQMELYQRPTGLQSGQDGYTIRIPGLDHDGKVHVTDIITFFKNHNAVRAAIAELRANGNPEVAEQLKREYIIYKALNPKDRERRGVKQTVRESFIGRPIPEGDVPISAYIDNPQIAAQMSDYVRKYGIEYTKNGAVLYKSVRVVKDRDTGQPRYFSIAVPRYEYFTGTTAVPMEGRARYIPAKEEIGVNEGLSAGAEWVARRYALEADRNYGQHDRYTILALEVPPNEIQHIDVTGKESTHKAKVRVGSARVLGEVQGSRFFSVLAK